MPLESWCEVLIVLMIFLLFVEIMLNACCYETTTGLRPFRVHSNHPLWTVNITANYHNFSVASAKTLCCPVFVVCTQKKVEIFCCRTLVKVNLGTEKILWMLSKRFAAFLIDALKLKKNLMRSRKNCETVGSESCIRNEIIFNHFHYQASKAFPFHLKSQLTKGLQRQQTF